MLLSFDYAARTALQNEVENGVVRPENLLIMQQWAQFWQKWVSVTFLRSYLKVTQSYSFIPKEEQELQVLLDCYRLENVIQDLGNDLNQGNASLTIPLQLLLDFSVYPFQAPTSDMGAILSRIVQTARSGQGPQNQEE